MRLACLLALGVLAAAVAGPPAALHAIELPVRRTDQVQLSDPARGALVIQNRGSGWVTFEPTALNGRSVFHSLADVQAAIDALPSQPPDNSPATRIFRFVADNRRHALPLTLALDWLLTPNLFFDSTGIAACGEAAALVNILATARGLPARRMGLNGHVVAEVYEGGRWKMFDADYGVYYLNRSGRVASVAELEADPSLITQPLLRLPILDNTLNPYTTAQAGLYAPPNGLVNQPVPNTQPARRVRFSLPRGASLRLPGRSASPPPDMLGRPLYDYRNLVLRLPAGVTGLVDNPLIVHTVRGAGSLEIAGRTYAIGSQELRNAINTRNDALVRFRIVESRGPIEIVYLLNPQRFVLGTSNALTSQVSSGATLDVRGVATGRAGGADTDGDGVLDDGGGNAIAGDQPCAGSRSGCDDNCPLHPNPAQRDDDLDTRGNACDGDLDGDELLTLLDSQIVSSCRAGISSAADPNCRESDLDEDGAVRDADLTRFSALVAEFGGLAASATGACGLGPELVPALLALQALTALRRRARGP